MRSLIIDRARAVAEQNARSAIVPVENAREHFGPHHQRAFVHPAPDETVRARQRIDESAAHRLHVECRAALDSELGLEQTGRAGENKIGGRRGEHDQINLARGNARGLQRAAARLQRQIARGLRLVGDVSLRDTRTFANPGVAGIEARREFVVGDDPGRQKAACAEYARVDHWTAAGGRSGWTGGCSCAMRCAMRCRTLFRTSSTAPPIVDRGAAEPGRSWR